jgi:Pyridoxamine 5'-phosphate oxidase
MTATLPPEVQRVFERFVTTELTTVDATGQPITWPVTPYYKAGGGAIDVTTGIGYPKKADDAAKNPRVSLLFSDPTGSGIEQPCAVLVQGTAQVDYANLEENRERYWRESAEKLPATKEMHPPGFMRSLFDWYYMRLYIYVRPERVFVWNGGDFSGEPTLYDALLEEVRSHHSVEPAVERAAPAGGSSDWDDRMDELGRRHGTAVLSVVGPDGFPMSSRLAIEPDRAGGRVRLGDLPEWMPATPGRACLTAHEHDPEFRWQANFQVRGDLVRDNGGWSLVPHKFVGGFELPKSKLQAYRENFSKMMRYRRKAKKELGRRRARGA